MALSKEQAESFLSGGGGGQPAPTAADHPFSDSKSAESFLDSDDPIPQPAPAQGGEKPQSGNDLPFWIKAGLSAHDSTSEREMFLQKVYGKDAVTKRGGLSDLVAGGKGKEKLFVKVDGKDVEVPTDFGMFSGNFTAGMVGSAAEMGGAAVGAAEGGAAGLTLGGPVGGVVGAAIGSGVGALGGYALKQIGKEAAGTYNKTGAEAVDAGLDAYLEGAAGEVGGQLVGKAAKSVLSGKIIPRFMSGVTDESAAKAEKAWDAGARPSYVSIAPGSRKLARIEIDSDKLTGKSLENDERNFKYVQGEIRNMLTESGLPKGQVDGIMGHISNPNAPPFVGRAAGEVLQKGVRAQVETLEHHVTTAGAEADKLIDTRIGNIDRMIESHPAGMLADDTADMIRNAKKSFSSAASDMYERIHENLGGALVVPTDGIRAAAKQITSLLPKTSIAAMVKEMSQLAEKTVTPEDAVLLKEFGIEVGTDKISLKDAQRMRTVLFEKGGAANLTRNVVKGDHLTVAHAVDDAIQAAGSDPQASAAIKALNQADGWYKANIAKFKNSAMNQVVKETKSGMPPDPQKIVNIIAEPGRSIQTKKIREVVGPDIWKRVQSTHMGMVMTDASSMGEHGGRVIDGMKLLDHLKKPETMNVFKAVHGDEAAADVIELGKMLASRKGTLSPETLINGDVKGALTKLRANEKALDEYLNTNLLAELRDPKKTGEDVFRWAVEPGKESRIMQVAKTFGENSPQMAELRQAGLEMLARNANMKVIIENGTGAIDRSLNEFSAEQKKLLFPGSMEKDLRGIQDVINYMFPLKSDVGMAGMHVGAVLERPLLGGKRGFLAGRLYAQTMAVTMRLLVQHPTMARWLVTGRKQDTGWIVNTANVLKQMVKNDMIASQAGGMLDPAQHDNPEKAQQIQAAKSMQQGTEDGGGEQGDDGASGPNNPDAPGVPRGGKKPKGPAGDN